MSFDFNQLQQTLNQMIYNQRNIIDRWRKFLMDPAGNVDFSFYDQNGNLQTVSVPNRQKLVNDFIASANSVMAKTVYVDQANGNDGNDGSINSPFKTLQRAIESVPAGGRVIIKLKNNYTMTAEAVEIHNKFVRLDLEGYTLTADTYVDSANRQVLSRFELYRSLLYILYTSAGGQIVVNNTSNLTPAGYLGFITMRFNSMFELLHHLENAIPNYPTITLANKICFIHCFGPNDILIRSTSNNATIKFNSPDAKFLVIDSASLLLNFSLWPATGVFFKDENGNVINPDQLVSTGRLIGLVRDSATGIPLNVVSNYRL